MKEILKKIFTKIQTTGTTIIDTTFLKDNSWFYITNEMFESKTVYIFRSNGELLISKNGNITKAHWENLVHSTNSLIIEIGKKATLYNLIYLTSDYLILQKDGTEIIEVFIKQERYDLKIPKSTSTNTIDYVLSDLKQMLNERNRQNILLNDLKELKGNKKKELKAIQSINEYEVVNPIVNKREDKNKSSNFEYFDILELLEQKKRNGEIRNKEEETYYIIELQNREEELIEFGEICGKCKAIGSIKDGRCLACEEKNAL